MDLLITLGRTLGFSFAAGVNLYATVAILGLAARYDWVDLPAAVRRLRQRHRHRRGARAVCDRVRRRQGAVGRYAVGYGPYRDSSARRRADCRGDAGRRIADDAGARGAPRRHGGREHPRDEGGDAGHRQREPRAVLELVPEPRPRTCSCWGWGTWRCSTRWSRSVVVVAAAGADCVSSWRRSCAPPGGASADAARARAAGEPGAARPQLPTTNVSVQGFTG